MSVEGVKSHCDMENGTAALTAGDDASAQKTLEVLAAAGSMAAPTIRN